MKVKIERNELEQHFADQVHFLETSSALYDDGHEIEAKRLAVTLRVLLHDTSSSKSLLGQLDLKEKTSFYDSSVENMNEVSVGTSSYSALISMTLIDGNTTPYVPNLDGTKFQKIDFETWWNKAVFIDNNGKSFSRKNLILTLANQDGGAHVDPEIDGNFAQLSRNNSLGHGKNSGSGWEPLKKPEFAAVRQITHEVLKTLKPGYKKELQLKGDGYIIGCGGIVIMPATNPQTKPLVAIPEAKVGRNAPCPCGSLKKYKKCCGQQN